MNEGGLVNLMEQQLELIAKSYDKAIEFGKQGIDLYKDLPEYITNDPDFSKWSNEEGGSSCNHIKEYLAPQANMKLIDLGCSLNLMFRGYDTWPSTYYGIDISSKTIELLHHFVAEKQLPIGSLVCGSIHETPYEESYFDIAACIGILEYYEKDFVKTAIKEMHRIIKPGGKLVLDIPNIGEPICRIMMLIEEHLERPDRFDMLYPEFEEMIKDYFGIEKVIEGAMMQYFLICKK